MRLILTMMVCMGVVLACERTNEPPILEGPAEAASEEETIESERERGLTETQSDLLILFRQWMETGITERTAYGAGWQQNIDYIGRLIDESETGFEQDLFNRVMREQYGRLIYPFTSDAVIELYETHGVEVSLIDAEAIHPRIGSIIFEADQENTAWLKAELDRRNNEWWTISEFGEDVSRHMWLLTQHADQDRDFQRHALELMEPLVAEGEILPRNFAYLYDRVAVGEGRPQRFGSQLGCYDGQFNAGPLEQPDKVDELRADVGLPPLQVYIDGEFFDQSRAACEASD